MEAGSAEPEVGSTKTRAPGKRRGVRGAVGIRQGPNRTEVELEAKSPRPLTGPPKRGSSAVTEGLIGERRGASQGRTDSERDADARL